MPASQVEDYHLRAAQCERLAQTTTDFQNKRMLLQMARAWVRLAEQAIKNSKTTLVYETPVPYTED
jgi:hypothetical protein